MNVFNFRNHTNPSEKRKIAHTTKYSPRGLQVFTDNDSYIADQYTLSTAQQVLWSQQQPKTKYLTPKVIQS